MEQNEDQNNRPRERGNHLKRNETKSIIIEFILGADRPAQEFEIRKFLAAKKGIKDQGTVNKLLHMLEKEGCIELIGPKVFFRGKSRRSGRARSGLPNIWDIKTTENLRKIKDFSEQNKSIKKIAVREFKKSFDIILRESKYSVYSFDGFIFYILLLTSTSFFNACIEEGFKNLYEGFLRHYQRREGYQRYQNITFTLNECCKIYTECDPKNEITKEEFQRKMGDIVYVAQKYLGIYGPEATIDLFKANFPGLSKESLLKAFEDIYHSNLGEILPVHTIPEGSLPAADTGIRSENLEESLIGLLPVMLQERSDFEKSLFFLLSSYYFTQDDIMRVISVDESNLKRDTEGILHKYSDCACDKDKDKEKRQLAANFCELASKIVVKYKQPTEHYVSDNVDEVYEHLLMFYNLEDTDYNY